LAFEVEAQRQRMQMAEYGECDAAHGALRHLHEHNVAQLGKQRGRHSQNAVGHQQHHRHGQRRLGDIEAIDDFLHHQRHRDIGQLGDDEESQGQDDAATILPEVRNQYAHHLPVAGGDALARLS
jgi:hypothetical protein